MVGDVLVVVIVQLQVVILEVVRSISIISSSYFQFTNPKSYHINCVRFLARCRISMCQGLGPKSTMKFRKSTVAVLRLDDDILDGDGLEPGLEDQATHLVESGSSGSIVTISKPPGSVISQFWKPFLHIWP